MSKTETATPAASSPATTGQLIAGDTNSAIVPLDKPIRRGEQAIESLTLRKPDAGSLRGLKLFDVIQMDVLALQTLLPRISSPTLTTADVAQLDPADLLKVGTEVAAFFVSKEAKASL